MNEYFKSFSETKVLKWQILNFKEDYSSKVLSIQEFLKRINDYIDKIDPIY